MNAPEQVLLAKIKSLSPQNAAEVEDFVDFLSAKSKRDAAFDRLLAIVPSLEQAGVQPVTEDEIRAEVKTARAERHARREAAGHPGDNAA